MSPKQCLGILLAFSLFSLILSMTEKEKQLRRLQVRLERKEAENLGAFVHNLYPEIGGLTGTNELFTESMEDDFIEHLQAAGKYMQLHKYTDFDRRVYAVEEHLQNRFEPDLGRPTYMLPRFFPKPPLQSLHRSLGEKCKRSLYECIKRVADSYWYSKLKTYDEVWSFWKKNRKRRTFGYLDKTYARPFINPLDLFIFRTTASYFLCYYTLTRAKRLRFFKEDCIISSTLRDYRDGDLFQFGCAELSFCPDPCFGNVSAGVRKSLSSCTRNEYSACYKQGTGFCNFPDPEGTVIEWRYLIQNRFNYTCDCMQDRPVWNQRTKQCDNGTVDATIGSPYDEMKWGPRRRIANNHQ